MGRRKFWLGWFAACALIGAQAEAAQVGTGVIGADYAPVSAPPPSFTSAGVHFDPWAASMFTSGVALSSTGTSVPNGDTGAWADSDKYLVGFLFRCPVTNPQTSIATFTNLQATCMSGDFVGSKQTGSDTTETQKGIDHTFDQASGVNMTLRSAASDSSGDTASTNGHNCVTTYKNGAAGAINDNAWHSWVEAMDGSDLSTTTKRKAVYIDGVRIDAGCLVTAVSGDFKANFSNTDGFNVAGALKALSQNAQIELDQVYVDSSWSGTLDISNNLPSSVLQKFWNSGPVDLGANCSTLFSLSSHAPQLCFRGGASGFVTNQGTVTTAFTATNVADATYGAGGPTAHVPYVVAGPYTENVAAGAFTTFTANNTAPGMARKAGNLAIATFTLLDSSSANTGRAMQCGSGWTQLLYSPATAATFQSTEVCYKFYAADGEADSFSPSWTTSCASNCRALVWTMTVFGNVNASTPFRDHQFANYPPSGSSTTTTMAVPAVTTAVGDLVLDYVAAWANPPLQLGTPTGENRLYGNGGGGFAVISFQRPGSGGTLAARTVVPTAADDATGISLSLEPN